MMTIDQIRRRIPLPDLMYPGLLLLKLVYADQMRFRSDVIGAYVFMEAASI